MKNQKNYVKGRGYDGLRLILGQGLVTSDGEVWRQDRRLMQPFFTASAVNRFTDMMVEVIDQMLSRWQEEAQSGRPLHMDEEMMRLTTSVIGRSMFSMDLGEQLDEVGQAFREAFQYIPKRTANPLALPLSVPLPEHTRFHRNMEVIESFIQERIAAGRKSERRDDLLSILLNAQDEESGYRLSQQQLRDEVITLFFAGFETTARSLTWGWHLLGQHPEAAQKVAEEADRELGGRLPTHTDLSSLKYSRMVVDETLRLYPPTALLARQNVEADEIGGYVIPPNSFVILVPFFIHRYPGIWEQPDEFIPERFSPDAPAHPKPAYIPFASGPRVCLGNSFALLEMILTFSMAAQRFHLEPVEGGEIGYEFAGTIHPSQSLWMRASRR